MNRERIFKLDRMMESIKNRLQELSKETDVLNKEYKELLDEWVKEQPYFKVELMAEDSNGEYTYLSTNGFRFDLDHWVKSAKSRMKVLNDRVVAGKRITVITKAYVWKDVPYKDIDKELIGLYKPTVTITLKDI